MGNDHYYLHAPMREQVFCLWKHLRKGKRSRTTTMMKEKKQKREKGKKKKPEESA